jgi:hypothetical protein
VISARDFCRERGFPHALFLTYSFDPLFFERVPLRDLERGGSRNIVIAADAGQLREAMAQSLEQLVHLGRSYVLAETVTANTFHPKLIARLSPTEGRIWIGTGNLTYTGWGGNQELATAWSVGPQHEDRGGWLSVLLDAVASVVPSSTFATQIDAVRGSVPWLSASSEESGPAPVLFSTPTRPLAPQLAARWNGRKFEELRLCTGSTVRRQARHDLPQPAIRGVRSTQAGETSARDPSGQGEARAAYACQVLLVFRIGRHCRGCRLRQLLRRGLAGRKRSWERRTCCSLRRAA